MDVRLLCFMQLKIPIIDFQINVKSQLGVSGQKVGEVGESSIEIHNYILTPCEFLNRLFWIFVTEVIAVKIFAINCNYEL